ncbi:M20 metallopeptidase family protein [Tuberibacillus sp. Marseille-P3662]|uniref:M20 metallopeptidase family protein n=1 Tax=Tuberibacillus sp. Marseille-P3662 TaxID=1965358 RepID=UPI00111C576F|nr:amidohydrolase [Tuberibacillus sp. Marseille-P3662]
MPIKSTDVKARADAIQTQLTHWRRHLHKYPELGFEETATSQFVEQELRKMGVYELVKDIGGTGIVAILHVGAGPVVGLRADMDALPVQETTGEDYQSQNVGVMHACGHDAHTAMLLGVAHLLADEYKQGHLHGTIKLLFQPAEETADGHGLTGAPYVLQSGALDDIDMIAALHMCPWRNPHEIQINDGLSMANIDNFKMIVKGSGGHGGYPHQGSDPIWMTANLLQNVYGLISRRIDPLEVGTISVGEIKGGQAPNVIPEDVYLSGTMRSYTPETRAQLIHELKSITEVLQGFGGTVDLEIERGEPALNNDPHVNELIRAAATSVDPEITIYNGPFGMGGEDFGHIIETIPGAMFFLGCALSDGKQRDLHTSGFQIDERVLPIGTAILVETLHQMIKDCR